MGLDMYLNRVTFFSTHNRPEGVKIEVPGMTHIDPAKVQEIREQVGYWRKANQIHAWFVKYVQGGEDKCRPFSVSAEQLAELLALCKQIVAVKDNAKRQELAAELLPTQAGFFFGSTEYDDYYFEDIVDTINILEPLVGEMLPVAETGEMTEAEMDPDWYTSVYYEYQSSW